jgi:hypothetical protein
MNRREFMTIGAAALAVCTAGCRSFGSDAKEVLQMNGGGLRRILEGVPKVAFAPIHDGNYEFTPYPSCLRSVLRYLFVPYIRNLKDKDLEGAEYVRRALTQL